MTAVQTTVQVILVLTNLPDPAAARILSRQLIEGRLAACINVLPIMESNYYWEGAIQEASEVCLMIKTTQARYAELEVAIRSAHPYDLPEIIALPISAGLPEYLGWIEEQTTKDQNV